jgi:alkylation response protein AidB-like acyl-CoA dehydrogenase
MSAGQTTGLDKETLQITLDSLRTWAKDHLTDEKLLEWDEKDEFPEEVVRAIGSEEVGIQLLFIPERFGGMGGGAFDVYRICEEMGRWDLGIATGVLATFLGSDPIVYGGTEEQKARWLGAIAEEGHLMAYGATEPGRWQRPRGAEDHGRRTHRRRRQNRRLQDQRQQAVDLQRRVRRPLHDPGQNARRADLVRRRSRDGRLLAGASPRTSTAFASPTPRR